MVNDGGAVIAHPTVTYVPGPAAPVDAGTYTANATFPADDTHETSSGSAIFTIAQAPSTTTVTAANATYDGNPHGGTAKVTGAGGLDQNLTVTYAGRLTTVYGPSSTAPTAAGDDLPSANYRGGSNHVSRSNFQTYSIARRRRSPSLRWPTRRATATHGGTAKVTGAGGSTRTSR